MSDKKVLPSVTEPQLNSPDAKIKAMETHIDQSSSFPERQSEESKNEDQPDDSESATIIEKDLALSEMGDDYTESPLKQPTMMTVYLITLLFS